MNNQPSGPTGGAPGSGKQDWWKRWEVALAIVLILSGVLSFIQVYTGVDAWHYFWPLILIGLGAGILVEHGGWF